MDDSLREQVREAFNAAEKANSSDSAPVDNGGGSVGTEVPTTAAADSSGVPAGGLETSSGADARSAAERARDSAGRFAKGQATATEAPKGQVAASTTATKPAAASSTSGSVPPVAGGDSSTEKPAHRAPQSWTPAEREHFTKAPPEVQAAIARREFEVQRVLNEAAPARKFQQEFTQAVQPFEGMLRNAGLNPVQAMQSAFSTIHQLQTYDPKSRAQVIANLMRTYPTDVEALAAHIDGTPQPQGGQQSQSFDPQALAAQVEQQVLQRIQAQRAQVATTSATRTVEAFAADPKNEFFEDVWPDMAGLIDAAKARNVVMPLEEAYARATWANPEIRAIVQQREQAKSAGTAQAATQRAQQAGSSIRNQPASPVNGHSGQRSTVDDVRASIARLTGR